MNLDKNTYEEIKGEAQKEMDRVLKLEETRENLKQRLLQKIEDIRTNLQAGKDSLAAGNFEASAQYYQLVIELDPENKEALKGFSKANKKLTRERKKLYKVDIKVLFSEAKVFIKNDDYKGAIESYKRILELDPSNKKALKLLEKAEQKYSFAGDDEHYEELFGKPDLGGEEALSGVQSVDGEDDFASEDVLAIESKQAEDEPMVTEEASEALEKETDDYVQDLIRESVLSETSETLGAKEEEAKQEVKDIEETELSDEAIDKLTAEITPEEITPEEPKAEEVTETKAIEETELSDEDIDKLTAEITPEEITPEAPKAEEVTETKAIEETELSDEDIDKLTAEIIPEEITPEEPKAEEDGDAVAEAVAQEAPIEQALTDDDIDSMLADMESEGSLDSLEVDTKDETKEPVADVSGAAVMEDINQSISQADSLEVATSGSALPVEENEKKEESEISDILNEDELAALTGTDTGAEAALSGSAIPEANTEEASEEEVKEESSDTVSMDDMLAGVVDEYNSVSGGAQVSGSADAVKSQASSEEASMDDMLAGVIDEYNASSEPQVSGAADTKESSGTNDDASMDDMLEGVIDDYNQEVEGAKGGEAKPATEEKKEAGAGEEKAEWGMEGVDAEAVPAKEGGSLEEKLDSEAGGEKGEESKEEAEGDAEVETGFKEEEEKPFFARIIDKFIKFMTFNVQFKLGTIIILGIMLAVSLISFVVFQNYTETSAKFFMQYNEKIEKQIEQADKLLKDGEIKDAYDLLSSVSGILPGESHGIDMHYSIIEIFRKRGGSDHNVLRAAIELYDDLTHKYENNRKVSKAYMEIGNCYMELKLYDEAIDRYKILLQKFPSSDHVPKTLLNIGKCYLKLGQYSKAKRGLFSLYSNYTDSEYAQEALYELGNCFDAEAKKLAED